MICHYVNSTKQMDNYSIAYFHICQIKPNDSFFSFVLLYLQSVVLFPNVLFPNNNREHRELSYRNIIKRYAFLDDLTQPKGFRLNPFRLGRV